ncbi:MAG TPA: O-antigen ligase family protein [Bordetella sp.]|jgi:O-antigen ligase|nr:O-antigen ligase family protein [Bordetella sp.]
MPSLYSRLAAILALLVPACALISADAGPALVYLSGLLALVAIAHNGIRGLEPANWRDLLPVTIAVCAPLASVLLTSVLTHGAWSASEFEKFMRFALACPICWLLLRAPTRWLQQVQWSLLFSALAGSVMLIVIMYSPSLGRGAVSDFGGKYNAVAFADLTLFFGFASLLTLPWTLSRWPRLERCLKILATLLSLYATWLSQTRSSWMLLPIFGLVVLLSRAHWSRKTKGLFVAALIVVLAAGSLALWESHGSRMRQVASDVESYVQDSDRDTSVGIRMQLWHASWLMFLDHPVIGTGARNFRANLAKLRDQGIVTPLVATEYGEPHNDLVSAMAGYGGIGLLAMLSLYLLPAVVFYRRLFSPDPLVQVGAQIGLLFCLGYTAFSLTEMMFRNMRSVPIYGVTMVVLFALTTKRRTQPVVTRSPAMAQAGEAR